MTMEWKIYKGRLPSLNTRALLSWCFTSTSNIKHNIKFVSDKTLTARNLILGCFPPSVTSKLSVRTNLGDFSLASPDNFTML